MTRNNPLFPSLRPMHPRDPQESHRASTPLELLFDLVSVIAIAAAAAGLHHAIAEAHAPDGLIKFAGAFFAIWWAWMNYTWFASAYDNDDPLFRTLTMVIMAGALTMAAGISIFFQSRDLDLIVIGFVIMRLAMVTLWLRAARHDPARRQTALWYAGGILVAQLYWVALAAGDISSNTQFFLLFAVGALLEMLVPALAERQSITPWHRHHIIERYGLLNIIVLGETLLAGSMALGKAASAGAGTDLELVGIAVSALVILFSLWSLYFSREEHIGEKRLALALTWGYGHLVIYMSGAAIGAGLAVMVDVATQQARISLLAGHYAIALPVATYLLGLWFVRDRMVLRGRGQWLLPAFAVLVLLAPLYQGLEAVAVTTLLAVILRNRMVDRPPIRAT